ncbi:adenylyl-sulfate kinase [Acidobacteria bacterium AH-259-D05]|nr:adenylyl-sulfate kinase [Acidobacteria bacterium AH-259-D05]
MLNGYLPGTIFITGLSASGKTTLGTRLHQDLLRRGYKKVILLDGEVVRRQLASQDECFGYSTEDRKAYSLELAKMARSHTSRGFIAILCAISHVKETRGKMREIVGNVMEVYLDCPVDICAARDYKGHYKKAKEGLYDNFIGITEPYQVSDDPELILDTATCDVDESAEILEKEVVDFLNNTYWIAAHR